MARGVEMEKPIEDKGKSTEKWAEKAIQGDSKNLVQRDKHGRLLPGSKLNPSGISPHKKDLISPDTLLDTLKEAEKRHKKPLMAHIWDVAYKDNKFLAKVIDKFIANKGIDLAKFTGAGQFNVIINTYSSNDKDKVIDVTLDNNNTYNDTQQEQQ